MPMRANLILLRGNGNGLDEEVLQLLSQANQPLCVSTLAFLLNRPARDICMALNKLRKYSEVSLVKVTAKRLQFWTVKKR